LVKAAWEKCPGRAIPGSIVRWLATATAWLGFEVSSAAQIAAMVAIEQDALHQLVRDPFETFRVQAAGLRDGQGLPRFVEQEVRDFLTCGWVTGRASRCSSMRRDGRPPGTR